MGRVVPRALAEEQTGSRGGNPRERAVSVRTWPEMQRTAPARLELCLWNTEADWEDVLNLWK